MIVKATTKYGNIYVSDKDHIGKILLSGENFEDELISECIKHIKDDTAVLDIGANIGIFSLAFLSKNCKVHAFEPQFFCIELLNKTFNGNSNIKIYHNAVGFQNLLVHMSMIDDQGEFYNGNVCKNLGGLCIGVGGEEVEMIRIDDLDIKNISVIKIDVEGYEYNVINGARKTIIKEKPFIVFESQHMNKEMLSSILNFLQEIGYKCEEKIVDNLKNYICHV